MWAWLKGIAADLAKLAAVILTGWFLWRQVSHRRKAQDQAHKERNARAKAAGKKAQQAREKAHTEMHKAADAGNKARERIEQLEKEAADGDQDLGDSWSRWADERNERLRDD